MFHVVFYCFLLIPEFSPGGVHSFDRLKAKPDQKEGKSWIGTIAKEACVTELLTNICYDFEL